MNVISLKTLNIKTPILCGAVLLLTACSGDGRPLLEAVEAAEVQLRTLTVIQPEGLLPDLFVSPGDQLTFSMTGTNEAGFPVNLSSTGRRWGVDNSSVATIDESGTFKAVGEGQTNVSIRIGGIASANFLVTVRDEVLESIDSIVGEDTLERCLPSDYSAIGQYAPVDGVGEGSLRGLVNAQWSVGDDQVGSVTTPLNGLATVTGVNASILDLSVLFEGQALTKSITVSGSLLEISVGPENAFVPLDTTLDLIATGRYSNDDVERNVIITDAVFWQADENNGVLSVSNFESDRGQVTPIAVGNTAVTAFCGDLSGQKSVTVTEELSSSSTDGLSFEDGDSLSLSLATGSYSLELSTGSSYDEDDNITDDAQWSIISGPSVASVNTVLDDGVVTLLSVGIAVIRVTYDGQFSDLTLTVF